MNGDYPGSGKRGIARRVAMAILPVLFCFLFLAVMPNVAMAWPNPSLAGSVATGTMPSSVCVQGGYAYLVNQGSNTLQVFNVSNPAAPSQAGSVATGTSPLSVSVQGNYAYVVNYDSDTLQIFNVSNPASPSLAGSAGTGSKPISVCVQDGYAYVANNTGNTLQVFNVSNPAAPSLVGSAGTGSNPQSVFVQGNYAYVVNMTSDTLQVFSVSNPAAPSLTGSAGTGSNPSAVYAQGGYAYVTNQMSDTLQVFSVSNPASPSLVGSAGTGSQPISVFVQGNYAYVANVLGNTLQVFDVSSPASPALAGSAATGDQPSTVCVQGGYAYVGNWQGNTMQVFTISPPASPLSVGLAATGDNPGYVTVQGGYAYVLNYAGETLQVFDASNPASPAPAGSAATGSGPISICVQGGYAYVVNVFSNSLQVFDVSNPAAPVAAGTAGTGSLPESVCVQGGYAYVANHDSRTMQVFNVSNPASPTLAGTAATGLGPISVCTQGNYAYLLNSVSNTLQVFNVSNPASPTLAGSAATGINPGSVCVQGGYAYVANHDNNTMQVFNVSNPASPTLAGSAATGINPGSVCVQGGYAYVTNRTDNTMQVFSLWTRTAPTVTTIAPTMVTGTTADSGGNVTADGGDPVTSRGVCWSTNPDPTIAHTHTTDGTGTGVFSSNITGLTPGTHYYVRAYATNAMGTAYGAQKEFTTENPVPLTSYYLAEGSNAWGFSTYINIENPNDGQVTAKITYMDTSPPNSGKGIVAVRTVILPPLSQTSVSSYADIGEVDFSTKVECPQGMILAVDRTMFWTGTGYAKAQSGYHNSIGTETPSRTWYLPEGSSEWGFETWTLLLNPNPNPAGVTLTYMTQAGPAPVHKTVPANSRASFNMADDIGARDASIKVTSDIPVVAERSMYRNSKREGSCSIGTTTPATDFYLAEGATGYDVGFTTYVLVQNPANTTNEVALTFQTQSGAVEGPSFTMRPNSRKTVRLNDYLPENTNVSTLVHGSHPLIAERAMYWDNGTGEGFHASVGVVSPHAIWMLPDGQTDRGCQTWTLIQNPNPSSVTVRITYLPRDGGKAVSFTDEIAPKSRSTYDMAAGDAPDRASILVTSLDGARPVIVERSMYWNNRGGGTDTIGEGWDLF